MPGSIIQGELPLSMQLQKYRNCDHAVLMQQHEAGIAAVAF